MSGHVSRSATNYTTGQAAKLCGISQQTIIRCFDSGRLKGFRVPGGTYRLVPRANLLGFMLEHGIPIDALGELSAEEAAQVASVRGKPAIEQAKLTTENRLAGVQ